MANFRAKVLKYFTDRPGEVVYRTDVAMDLGLRPEQVMTCIYNIRKDNPAVANDLQVVVSGNAWRYVPTSTAVPTSSETPPATVNGATRLVPATATVPRTVAAPRPAATTGNRVFEEIGESQDGTVIIQESETGALYRATLI